MKGEEKLVQSHVVALLCSGEGLSAEGGGPEHTQILGTHGELQQSVQRGPGSGGHRQTGLLRNCVIQKVTVTIGTTIVYKTQNRSLGPKAPAQGGDEPTQPSGP